MILSIAKRMSVLTIVLVSVSIISLTAAYASDTTKPDTVGAHIAPPVVDGFRSSRFGMTEQQVRDAIHSDFPSAKPTVVSGTSEKTNILTMTIPNLLPEAGDAIVSYIFGYNSKKLAQVSIAWPGDEKAQTPEVLINAGNILRDYFISLAFPRDTMVVNGQAEDGTIIFFRGVDAKGRMVILTLNAVSSPSKDAGASVKSNRRTLHLTYVLDVQNPDIFRLPKGAF